jgi:hypothetical protein
MTEKEVDESTVVFFVVAVVAVVTVVAVLALECRMDFCSILKSKKSRLFAAVDCK